MADRVVPPAVALIVADRVSLTAVVVTVKLALLAPPGTVTLAGTLATPGLLLESDATKPPDGAAAVTVTVPVTGFPPITLIWLRVSDDSEASPEEEPVAAAYSRCSRTDVRWPRLPIRRSHPRCRPPVG